MAQLVIQETIKLKQQPMSVSVDHVNTDDRNILVYPDSGFSYSSPTQSRYIVEKTIEVNYG